VIILDQVKRISTTFVADIIANSPLLIEEKLKAFNLNQNLPLKYDKEVINNIYNEFSIFKGYDPGNYGKKEMDRMKRVILTAKYDGVDDVELRKRLIAEFDISTKRAILIARAETQSLDSSVMEIYSKNAEVLKKFKLVWISKHDKAVRPDHESCDGLIADAQGMFHTSAWGAIRGPSDIPQKYRWNCRCSIKLVPK
jgi:uncharacterized protein with gpF-like domain